MDHPDYIPKPASGQPPAPLPPGTVANPKLQALGDAGVSFGRWNQGMTDRLRAYRGMSPYNYNLPPGTPQNYPRPQPTGPQPYKWLQTPAPPQT